MSQFLRAIRQNGVSLLISSTALGGYGGWMVLPDSASVHMIYERYVASEESRPRLFDEGVAIRLNREAPPVAALEEALRDQPWAAIEPAPGFGVKPTELKLSASGGENVALAIIADNKKWQEAAIAATVVPRAPVAAPASYLPSLSPARVLEQKRVANTPPVRRGTSFAYAPAEVSNAAPRPLPPAPAVVATEISQKQLGLSREQILAAIFMPIATPAGGGAKGAGQPSSITVATAAAAPANQVDRRAIENDRAVGQFTKTDNGALAPKGRQILIRGSIELAGGLALTHAKDRIVVLREVGGQLVETGAVWIREARYEIFVESLEGSLIAEVRAPQGDVVGRGLTDLAKIEVTNHQRKVEGLSLKVNPVVSGLVGRVQSAYSSVSKENGSMPKGLQGARVDVDQTPYSSRTVSGGFFENPRFAEGSRVVVRARAKEHLPTVAMLTAGYDQILPVYTKKMMAAFSALASEIRPTPKKPAGLVWGRVARAGESVAGAKIHMLTEGIADPIYFNELMLPDATLTATSSNGLFAVASATAGLHSLQVESTGRISDPILFPAEEGAVSSLDLDTAKVSQVTAKGFDAFRTDWPLRTELRPLGHVKSRRVSIQGESGRVVKILNMGQPVAFDVDAGPDYVPTRVVQNAETRAMVLPMVQRGWFDRVLGRLRYNAQTGTGNVIGFIQGQRFKVSIDEQAAGAAAKILYFDSSGEITGDRYGEAGGGFILLGVKEGLRTLVVEADGSDRLYAATVLVEGGIVSSLSHWLR